MKNVLTKAIFIFLVALTFSPVFFSLDPPYVLPGEQEWFSVCIEQEGQVLPVRKAVVKLQKKPFTLVVTMKGPMGLLVNFSTDNTLYNGFRRGENLSEILETPDDFMGMAEELFNPESMAVIDEVSPHYLFYQDGGAHRFSTVEAWGEYLVCRRLVANYTTFEEDWDPIPIQELTANSLYISLLFSEYDKDYNLIELQKAALRLTFH